MDHGKITRSATVFGSFTLVSRILGMVRDIVIARLFGTSFAMSAYTIAFTFPNLFRRIFGEGTLVGAFVPVFTEEMEKQGKEPALKMASRMVPLLAFILLAIAGGIILVLGLIRSFLPVSEQADLVFSLAQWLMPYMVLICLAALFMGILNSLSHFAIPALSPCVLNLSLIFAACCLCPFIPGPLERKIYGLAAGVLAGGLLQFFLHLPVLKRKKVPSFDFRSSLAESWRDPAIRKIFSLMVPGIIGLSMNQINVIVDRFLSYVISDSAAAVLFYADRLVEFPLGIFGIAFATAVLPALSRHAAKKNYDQLKASLIYALRQVLFITVPATIGLLVLGRPIVRLLFERGAFDSASTLATSQALAFYAIGLFAYCGVKMTVPAFYAMKDMKTPIKIGFGAMGVNIVLNLILMWPLKEKGLALSTAVASMFNLAMLLYFLRKKLGPLNLRALGRASLRILLISLLMGVLAWGSWLHLAGKTGDAGLFARLTATFGAIAISILGYFVLCGLFRIPELAEFRKAFAHRSRSLPPSEPDEETPLRGE